MQIRSPLFQFPFIIELATFHHKGETDMNNDIIKLLNLEDDCVITAINFSDRQTKVVSLAKKPVEKYCPLCNYRMHVFYTAVAFENVCCNSRIRLGRFDLRNLIFCCKASVRIFFSPKITIPVLYTKFQAFSIPRIGIYRQL